MNGTDTATLRSADAPAASLPPIGVVAAVYEAFGRGDVPSLLALCAEDVVFDDDSLPSAAQRAGHPLLRTHRGKAEVTDFFAAVASCEMSHFEVVDLMSSADSSPDPASDQELVHVAARILIGITSPAGILVEDDEVHLWGIGPDGLVHTMKHYCDTAKHIASMGANGS